MIYSGGCVSMIETSILGYLFSELMNKIMKKNVQSFKYDLVPYCS